MHEGASSPDVAHKEARSVRVGLCRTQMAWGSRAEARKASGERGKDVMRVLGTSTTFLCAYPGTYCDTYIEKFVDFAPEWFGSEGGQRNST